MSSAADRSIDMSSSLTCFMKPVPGMSYLLAACNTEAIVCFRSLYQQVNIFHQQAKMFDPTCFRSLLAPKSFSMRFFTMPSCVFTLSTALLSYIPMSLIF